MTETLLAAKIREAVAKFNAMPPEEQEAHLRKQRESFVRGMRSAGHGMTREQIEARIAELDAKIGEATCWGAALGEMHEERKELQVRLRSNA